MEGPGGCVTPGGCSWVPGRAGGTGSAQCIRGARCQARPRGHMALDPEVAPWEPAVVTALLLSGRQGLCHWTQEEAWFQFVSKNQKSRCRSSEPTRRRDLPQWGRSASLFWSGLRLIGRGPPTLGRATCVTQRTGSPVQLRTVSAECPPCDPVKATHTVDNRPGCDEVHSHTCSVFSSSAPGHAFEGLATSRQPWVPPPWLGSAAWAICGTVSVACGLGTGFLGYR